jgi:hypothetical protein
MLDLPGTPMHVGMRYTYYREYQWTHPIPDVLSPMLPLDVRRLGYRGAGGVSFDLAEGAGTVAMELQMAREHWAEWAEERGAAAPANAIPDVSIGDVSYHFGAEYRAKPWLPLRAGVVLRRYDFDRRDGNPPYRGIRLSVGAAYRWEALGLVVRIVRGSAPAAAAGQRQRAGQGEEGEHRAQPSGQTLLEHGRIPDDVVLTSGIGRGRF